MEQQTITKFDEQTEKLIQLVLELKKQRNAVILVHNYQKPEMYKIGDYVGDSLGLSKQHWYAISWGIWEAPIELKLKISRELESDSALIFQKREEEK